MKQWEEEDMFRGDIKSSMQNFHLTLFNEIPLLSPQLFPCDKSFLPTTVFKTGQYDSETTCQLKTENDPFLVIRNQSSRMLGQAIKPYYNFLRYSQFQNNKFVYAKRVNLKTEQINQNQNLNYIYFQAPPSFHSIGSISSCRPFVKTLIFSRSSQFLKCLFCRPALAVNRLSSNYWSQGFELQR